MGRSGSGGTPNRPGETLNGGVEHRGPLSNGHMVQPSGRGEGNIKMVVGTMEEPRGTRRSKYFGHLEMDGTQR